MRAVALVRRRGRFRRIRKDVISIDGRSRLAFKITCRIGRTPTQTTGDNVVFGGDRITDRAKRPRSGENATCGR
jgi:hypothetical protein